MKNVNLYDKGTMAITAYMAKEQGVDEGFLQAIVKDAGESYPRQWGSL
jgi:hypothetical protein